MQNSIHLDWLRRFREDLRTGDADSLGQHVGQAGLDLVLDPAFMQLALQQDARQVVVLLSSLGVANSDRPDSYQRYLAAYQYLQGGIDLDFAASLCAKSSACPPAFYKEILTCAKSQKGLPHIVTYSVTLDDLQFSLELLVNVGYSEAIFPLLTAWKKIDASDKPWLLACRATTTRAMSSLRRAEAATLAAVTHKLIGMAPPAQIKVTQEMRVQWANMALKSRQGEVACLAAQSAFDHDDNSQRRFTLAKALVLDGQISKALEHMQFLLESALSDPAPVTAEIVSNSFNVSAAEDTLRRVNSILRAKSLEPFLMSGTLLGYAREGGLLPHDKDIDLGLIGWEHQFTVAQALLEAGHFHFDWAQLSGQNRYLISAHDLRNGMAIDFFLFHDKGDHFLHGIDFDMGFTQNFTFSKFGLEEVNFLGQKFYVPDNIDQNLTENYGDWRVPVSSYAVTVESPALCDDKNHRDLLIYLAILKIVTKRVNPKGIHRILNYLQKSNSNAVPAETLTRLYDWSNIQLNEVEMPPELFA